MAARAPVVRRDVENPGAFRLILRGLFHVLSVLLLALVFSILLEWIGMTIWWPSEGVHHSERVLSDELQYVNEDFKRSVLRVAPLQFARRAVAAIGDFTGESGLAHFVAHVFAPTDRTATWRRFVHVNRGFYAYVDAALNVAQTFAIRLTVLALSTPVFVLFGLVGLGEGLMRRDLRRWGGGRESAFVYHHAKKLLGPSMLTAWIIYLALPLSIPPNIVLLPFALAFAAGIAVTSATFKKYL